MNTIIEDFNFVKFSLLYDIIKKDNYILVRSRNKERVLLIGKIYHNGEYKIFAYHLLNEECVCLDIDKVNYLNGACKLIAQEVLANGGI